jgi:hypothetical protein
MKYPLLGGVIVFVGFGFERDSDPTFLIISGDENNDDMLLIYASTWAGGFLSFFACICNVFEFVIGAKAGTGGPETITIDDDDDIGGGPFLSSALSSGFVATFNNKDDFDVSGVIFVLLPPPAVGVGVDATGVLFNDVFFLLVDFFLPDDVVGSSDLSSSPMLARFLDTLATLLTLLLREFLLRLNFRTRDGRSLTLKSKSLSRSFSFSLGL